MTRLIGTAWLVGFVLAGQALAEGRWRHLPSREGLHKVEAVAFKVPVGWKWDQDAHSDSTILMGLARGADYLSFRVQDAGGSDFKSKLDAKAVIMAENAAERIGPFSWSTVEYRYQAPGAPTPIYGKGFSMEFLNHRYFGWARAASASDAVSMTRDFLESFQVQPIGPIGRSLTGVGYQGKKYYVGFGDYLSGFMGNEVKYDIQHTHDVFTKDIGGNYVGTKINGSGQGSSQLKKRWQELKQVLNKDDMYVQYSSGHGSMSGLAFGVSYDEIRDNALSYPASEIIVFTMACYSGNLVNSFDKKKSVWENWQGEGRTLFVMASSRPSETSSTGPMTDPQEPGGPSGSAGSAFGHALWKSLIGSSDGFVDGVKDRFISLGEIKDFSIWKTKQVGGHTPVATGVFNGGLVMNRVPTARELERFIGGTEGLTDDEIMERIQELDEMMRIR